MDKIWSSKWKNIYPIISEVKSLWAGFLKIWSSVETVYSQTDFTWGEVALAEEIQQLVGGKIDPYEILRQEENLRQWQKNLEKKKRAIRLLCKIKGETFKEEKDYKKVKLTMRDAKLIVNSVIKPKIEIKEHKSSGENKWHTNSIQIKVNNLSVH